MREEWLEMSRRQTKVLVVPGIGFWKKKSLDRQLNIYDFLKKKEKKKEPYRNHWEMVLKDGHIGHRLRYYLKK